MGFYRSTPELCTLVLNADMQPLSWGPLSVWAWQDALVAVLQGRVHQVSSYDVEVHSASQSFRIPSVISLKKYHKRNRISFTRYHVFLRDSFRCQYCDKREESTNLTFDHVVPRARGGTTCWTNIVTCCAKHNLQKADKTLKQSGLSLRRMPFEPTPVQLDGIARRQPIPDNLHATWLDYLYWDSTLEPDAAEDAPRRTSRPAPKRPRGHVTLPPSAVSIGSRRLNALPPTGLPHAHRRRRVNIAFGAERIGLLASGPLCSPRSSWRCWRSSQVSA